jgi:hypothetical protein
LKLMAGLYFVGACTDKSAGFSPPTMRSTYEAKHPPVRGRFCYRHQAGALAGPGIARIKRATCSGSSSWTKCRAPGIRNNSEPGRNSWRQGPARPNDAGFLGFHSGVCSGAERACLARGLGRHHDRRNDAGRRGLQAGQRDLRQYPIAES